MDLCIRGLYLPWKYKEPLQATSEKSTNEPEFAPFDSRATIVDSGICLRRDTLRLCHRRAVTWLHDVTVAVRGRNMDADNAPTQILGGF